MSDARYILQNHYKDASRLDTRIQLHAKYSTNTQGYIHGYLSISIYHRPVMCWKSAADRGSFGW